MESTDYVEVVTTAQKQLLQQLRDAGVSEEEEAQRLEALAVSIKNVTEQAIAAESDFTGVVAPVPAPADLGKTRDPEEVAL